MADDAREGSPESYDRASAAHSAGSDGSRQSHRSQKPHRTNSKTMARLRSITRFTKIISRQRSTKVAPAKPKQTNPQDEEIQRILEDMARRNRLEELQERAMRRGGFKARVWRLVDEPSSSRWAYWLSVYMILLIVYSTIVFCAETLPSQENGRLWQISEIYIVINFTLEYVVRFLSCPNKTKFLKGWMNFIDLLSIIPFYVEVILKSAGTDTAIGGLAVIRVVRLARVFRLFKLGKHSEQLTLVARAARKSKDGIMLLFFMLSLTVVFFSAAMYYAELADCFQNEDTLVWYYKGGPEVESNESPFQSIVHTFWWTLVTLVTVGYGDDVPRTVQGKVVASLTMITGILVLAFPITLLGTSFAEVYAETKEKKIRRKVALIHRVASKVLQKKKKMSVLQLCELYKEISKDVNDAIGETRDSYVKIVRTLEYYQMATLELQQIVQAIVVAYELDRLERNRSASSGPVHRQASGDTNGSNSSGLGESHSSLSNASSASTAPDSRLPGQPDGSGGSRLTTDDMESSTATSVLLTAAVKRVMNPIVNPMVAPGLDANGGAVPKRKPSLVSASEVEMRQVPSANGARRLGVRAWGASATVEEPEAPVTLNETQQL